MDHFIVFFYFSLSRKNLIRCSGLWSVCSELVDWKKRCCHQHIINNILCPPLWFYIIQIECLPFCHFTIYQVTNKIFTFVLPIFNEIISPLIKPRTHIRIAITITQTLIVFVLLNGLLANLQPTYESKWNRKGVENAISEPTLAAYRHIMRMAISSFCSFQVKSFAWNDLNLQTKQLTAVIVIFI